MLPLIPAMIAVTIVLGYTISMTTMYEQNEVPSVISQNMMMHHRQAVDVAVRDDLTMGELHDLLGPVVLDYGDWNSRVISSDERTMVLTWAGPAAGFDDDDQIRAMALIGDPQFSGLPETAAGIYTYTEVGGRIGRLVLDDFIMPIGADVPAIVSIIKEEDVADEAGGEAPESGLGTGE